jgi:hypothetical protein
LFRVMYSLRHLLEKEPMTSFVGEIKGFERYKREDSSCNRI